MAKLNILTVEDDTSLAEVLDYNLSQTGYKTQIARDGQQGLREIRSNCPDLVLLDLMLPMIDGLDEGVVIGLWVEVDLLIACM